jgi:hypothetical protein
MAAELMRPIDDAITPGFVAQIPEVIAALSGTVQDVASSGRWWVFYGSMPLGADHEDSDLDALLLHDQPNLRPHRRAAAWNRRPVTVYVLSRDDLVDDGQRRRFGGYYALKLLSPFVADQRDVEDDLAGTSAGFLGPWANLVVAQRPDAAWSGDQLLAHAYLAFLDLYPDFAGYVARLLRDPVLLPRVWRHQRRVYTAALAREGFITPAGQPAWRYTGIAAIADPRRERSRCTARFWAFGSVCHGADAQFPDFYFTKTDGHATHQEQQSAYQFLRDVAEGGDAP